jgi:hypothetical protein
MGRPQRSTPTSTNVTKFILIFLTPIFAGSCFFSSPSIFVFCHLHCNVSSLPNTPPPLTKFWGSVSHIPSYPPAPPMHSSSPPIPAITSSELVTSHLLSFGQPLLDRFWGPCSSFDLPVTFGRSPFNIPTPLHCISSLTFCPCHRRKRPTGERFFRLPSPSLLSHVRT